LSNLKANLKQLKDYERELKEARKKAVYVGLPKDKVSATYDDGTSVIQIGAIHEFGMGRNPERSFLRVPFNDNQKKIKNYINKQYQAIFDGKGNTTQSLNKIGILARNISVAAFTDNDWKELSEARKRQKIVNGKRGDNPLINTGNLRQSITWSVR